MESTLIHLSGGMSPPYYRTVMQPLAVPVEANLIKITQHPPIQGSKIMKMSEDPNDSQKH